MWKKSKYRLFYASLLKHNTCVSRHQCDGFLNQVGYSRWRLPLHPDTRIRFVSTLQQVSPSSWCFWSCIMSNMNSNKINKQAKRRKKIKITQLQFQSTCKIHVWGNDGVANMCWIAAWLLGYVCTSTSSVSGFTNDIIGWYSLLHVCQFGTL